MVVVVVTAKTQVNREELKGRSLAPGDEVSNAEPDLGKPIRKTNQRSQKKRAEAERKKKKAKETPKK